MVGQLTTAPTSDGASWLTTQPNEDEKLEMKAQMKTRWLCLTHVGLTQMTDSERHKWCENNHACLSMVMFVLSVCPVIAISCG